ncbi:MAG: hypothetical protein A3E80_06255 [Chlamydiae bacterium RIFCSPHIGHO2_12_FULL_49_9]|nr:MAG: hypothetical protein A3E80_06255 [Chlamydiae bacterium RIFCSPHIGHO2_12_FULL_49_9]
MSSPTHSTISQDPSIFTKLAERPFFQVAAGAALIGTAYAVYALSIQAFSLLSGMFFPLLSASLTGSASFWALHSVQVIGHLVGWVVEHQFVVFCASYLILPAEEKEGIQRYLITAGKTFFNFLKLPGTAAFMIASSLFQKVAKYLPNTAAGIRDIEKVTKRAWGEFVGASVDTPQGSPMSGAGS